MTYFLLRDDDPNATTDPSVLESVYAPLFDSGLPVTFSVIPDVALDTRAPDGARERFIDSRYPNRDETVPLREEHPLAQWLRSNHALTDVLVHGLHHRRGPDGTEFGALSYDDAREAMKQGKDILARAIGYEPAGFVAPWDVVSKPAVRAAVDAFRLLSVGWVGRSRLPLGAWPAHLAERLQGHETLRLAGSWILRHRGGRLAQGFPPDDVPMEVARISKRARVAVIVLHHWMFSRDEPSPVVRALARALRGKTVVTARQLAEKLP